MNKNIDISIIIVSYNTCKILEDCLKSVVKHTKGINYEVIVVDNGSKDDSVKMVKKYSEKFSNVKLIDVGDNVGFGKGNNLGAQKASGKYLLFLNSDTLFTNNLLPEILVKLDNNPSIGVYSCGLLNADQSVQASGGYFPTLANLLAWQFFIDDLPLIRNYIKSFHPSLTFYKKGQKLDWVTGAFMIVPKNVFDKAGRFDEKIFMYTEEMELCFRISTLGLGTLFTSQPTIIHLGGASGGSFLALTSEIKYMIYFWEKHQPSWQLPIVKIAFFLGSLFRLIIFGIIKRDEKARRAYIHALKYTL